MYVITDITLYSYQSGYNFDHLHYRNKSWQFLEEMSREVAIYLLYQFLFL